MLINTEIEKKEDYQSKNNTFEEIGQILAREKTFLIFPHINMDGDALGSSVALCATLRNMGKEAYILIEDEVPGFLDFLAKDYCTHNMNIIENPDVCVAVDCGEFSRFPARVEKFQSGKITGTIDHHVTTMPIFDFNYIRPEAAATGELIFELVKTMGKSLKGDVSQGILTAITTDTGNFQYSNTTAHTHRITAELMDNGAKPNEISINLYQNIRLQKLILNNMILQGLKVFAGGRGIICGVTQGMIKETGARMEDTEGIVETIRNVKNVEVAVFVKELTNKECKISMRAKRDANVAEIAQSINGGGHVKAAGGKLNMSFNEAMKHMEDLVYQYIRKMD